MQTKRLIHNLAPIVPMFFMPKGVPFSPWPPLRSDKAAFQASKKPTFLTFRLLKLPRKLGSSALFVMMFLIMRVGG
ncbi:hypothetical protein, partial [Acetobacter senegalensis]|uniref:hypothetical protein n=1 Tax=Acetobacter senegalensis TaxID=446692 RepID=UPI0026527DCB